MRWSGLRYALLLYLASLPALTESTSGSPPPLAANDLQQGGVSSTCNWEVVLTSDVFSLADIAVDRAGRLVATGALTSTGDPPRLLTLLSEDGGASWRIADVFPSDGSFASSGYRLDIDDRGSIHVLAWKSDDGGYVVFLRRSDPTGEHWESSEQRWKNVHLGALRSDRRGRIHVALGFADPERGTGWTVESAPGGIGRFRVDDIFAPNVAGVFTVVPRDMAGAADGSLWVSGQLNGAPDRWVTRMRSGKRGLDWRTDWRTVDLFELSPESYGLAAAAIVPLPGGGAIVAGFGVEGGERNDYQWLTRLVRRRGEPLARAAFQLERGRHSMGLDAALDPAGDVLVAGTASREDGNRLQLRRSGDLGANWETLLSLSGNTAPWNVRVAVAPRGDYYVGGELDFAGVILHCPPPRRQRQTAR